MQCTNKLKQLGLAIHNYHDVNNNLPGHNNGPNENRTAFIPLYSFFEQSARYAEIVSFDVYDPSNMACNDPYSDRSCWHGNINDLLCPSDDGGSRPYTRTGHSGALTPTNYVFSEADYLLYQYGYPNNIRSPFGMAPSNMSSPTRWGHGSPYTFASVTDGLSNTIFLSERCAAPGTGENEFRRIKGGVANLSSWNNSHQACMNTRGVGGDYNRDAREGSGSNCAYIGFLNAFFHTILPPNAPSCHEFLAPSTTAPAGADTAALLPPTSNHSGGVNTVFGDGSVHFITETIDVGPTFTIDGKYNYPNATAYGDPSFGVWSRLGCMNDGLTVSIP
jgi:hypothetical protein